MDNGAIGSLAEFCISQRNHFVAEDWLAKGEADGKKLAFVAKYLSMTSWYGHAEELEDIAVRLYPPLATMAGFNSEAHAIEFDWSCFSTTVRIGIAMQLVEQAAAPVGSRGKAAASLAGFGRPV